MICGIIIYCKKIKLQVDIYIAMLSFDTNGDVHDLTILYSNS